MLLIIGIIVFTFLYARFVPFRIAVMHPINTIYYGITDLIDYIIHKKWNVCETGKLIAYTALFGKGKTLSVVHYICQQYKKYNNKIIWDYDRNMYVTQKIHIISNVDINVPYEKFVSLEQIVWVAEKFKENDYTNNTLTVTLVLGDEFSVQMNSREFKKNIDPLFLNTLLTCRHHHISLIYDAQRFNHVDALLRQVTSYVIECNKIWRFMVQYQYDASELEHAINPNLIVPKLRFGWFIKNSDYEAYDTLACVGNLKKSVECGDMLSEEDILNLQCNKGSDMDTVNSPSRKYYKKRRKAR